VATAGAGAATAGEAVASTEEVSAVAVSTVAVVVSTAEVLVVDFTGEASAVVVSVGDVSAVALSTALAFVVAVLVGATGVATGAITDSLMMSSSAASAFRGGGAGAIRTDITVTTITRTITMDTAGTRTATMDTADTVTMGGPVTDIAMAADQAISGVCGVGDKLFEIAGLLVRVDRIVSDVRDEAHLSCSSRNSR
jgi:hypothetical protein